MADRRAVLISVSESVRLDLRVGTLRLPEGVHIDAETQQIASDTWVLRLRGKLPAWVLPAGDGDPYPNGRLEYNQTGDPTLEPIS
jgi:hypothetical protein